MLESKLQVNPVGMVPGIIVVDTGAAELAPGTAAAGVRVQACEVNVMSSMAISPW